MSPDQEESKYGITGTLVCCWWEFKLAYLLRSAADLQCGIKFKIWKRYNNPISRYVLYRNSHIYTRIYNVGSDEKLEII